MDSRKELGKRVAELLFPPIRKRGAAEKGESNEEKNKGEG